MLALLLGLLASAGLLLRGSWDLWAQSALFIAVAGGTGLWLLSRLVVGYVPMPSGRLLAWAFLLAVLSGFSAYESPLPSYAVPGWRVLLLGLWIFCAISALTKDERVVIDQAVRVTGWILVLLAFYQYFHDGLDRPSSALLNQNVFAGAILLLLPLAVEHRDWLLSGALLLCLWWAHSVGAWLGLAGALVLTRRDRDSAASYIGLSVFFVCLVLIYNKLQAPEVLHRWHWWTAAWRMALERPLWGFGPATWAYAAPSFFDPGQGLSALYVHQHLLEAASELGWLYMAAWAAGLAFCLRGGGAPHKRFGALAILIQALWDYPLSIPGNFWLFCYFVASTATQTSRGMNVRHARKPAWALAVCAVSGLVCWWTARDWRADALAFNAVEAFKDGGPAEASLAGLEKSLALREEPEAERAAGDILLSMKPATEQRARAAAAHYENAARLNPYRPSIWKKLERLYAALGEPQKGDALLKEGMEYCPVLRESGGGGS